MLWLLKNCSIIIRGESTFITKISCNQNFSILISRNQKKIVKLKTKQLGTHFSSDSKLWTRRSWTSSSSLIPAGDNLLLFPEWLPEYSELNVGLTRKEAGLRQGWIWNFFKKKKKRINSFVFNGFLKMIIMKFWLDIFPSFQLWRKKINFSRQNFDIFYIY